jgi:general secretion pathway protein D
MKQRLDGSKNNEAEQTLQWLRILAGLSLLIALAGLIGLAAPNAFAADPPRPGMPSGSRAFSNPFANTPPPAQAPVMEEDDEDEDFSEDYVAPPGGNPPAGAGMPPAGNRPPVQPNTNPGVAVGGGLPSGVIERNKPPEIAVDTETGAGSKEVVTDFNFPDADIMDIAKALGKLTGKNFILDKDVKGRITIISNSPITVGDAWKAFLTALDINGFALIPSGKYIRIARQRDARDKQLKTYTGEFSPDTDALITRVFPLKYINAEEVARTFRSFMPANSRIIPYEQTNTVIVTDTGSNIAKLNKMLELLDVEGYDAGIEVIPVKFASAAELSKLIDTLLPGTGGTGQTAGAPRFGGSRFSARRTKEGGIINTIISDERTNTLIVHANSKGADQVRQLVSKLDQKMPAATGGRVHVVYLQFADAEQIANTLNNLGAASTVRPTGPTGGTGVNPVAGSLFEGAIKVAPDKATNSLVVTASPADFGTIQRVINRLDIPRDEVYVEVVVMEVQLNNDFAYSTGFGGAEIPSFTPNQDLLNWVTNPVSQNGLVLGFRSEGEKSFTVGGQTIKVPNAAGLIRALQTNSKSNILATPQIIALDNEEATFESTENLPQVTQTVVAGVGTTNTPTKIPVTLSISMKPQINKLSNFVKLAGLTIKIGDVVDRALPALVQDLAQATLDRTAKTTVVVGDGDTVVIGGLIRDRSVDTVRKIPILGDIPLLGWLFRAKTQQSAKSNLLVFLTPHIVRQYDKVRAILDKKLKERDDFLEKSAGGDDPLRDKRDDMIRSLPDINELTRKKAETAVTLEDEPITTAGSSGSAREGNSPFTGTQNQQQVPGQPAPAQPQAPPAQMPPGAPPFDSPMAPPPPPPPPMDSFVPPPPLPMDPAP